MESFKRTLVGLKLQGGSHTVGLHARFQTNPYEVKVINR